MIATTHLPATDLGYLLHKHPARLQSFELAFGKAHVFYPEASHERCTAALLFGCCPGGAGAETGSAGIIRERSPLCCFVVFKCGNCTGIRQRPSWTQ